MPDPIKESVRADGRAGQAVALPILFAVLIAAVDQLSKWVIVRDLGPSSENHRTELIGDLIAFHYVENSGAAFGMLRGQAVVLTVMAGAVVAAMIFSYRRTQHSSWQLTAGLGLLLGGAIGNLADRIRLGYVVDFFALSVWPKFNVADSAITIGVLLIAWHLLAYGASADVNIVLVRAAAVDRDPSP
jgi:signal peptidase II